MKLDRSGTPLKLVPFLTGFMPFAVIYSGRQFYQSGFATGLSSLIACAIAFAAVWFFSRLFVPREK